MLMDAESEQVESYRSDIERLKKRIAVLIDLLYKMEAKANNHEKLITRLCDALEDGGPRPFALIKEARDAVDAV